MMSSDLLIELSQLLVLCRDGHALQILVVPDRLEVTTYQQKVDLITTLRFKLFYVIVSCVQFSMATTFYCDLA
jgi:hypothetical protein